MSERNPDSGPAELDFSRPGAIIYGQLDKLTDEELLVLHRDVCRRAARIYEPMHRQKRDEHWRIAMAIQGWPKRKLRAVK